MAGWTSISLLVSLKSTKSNSKKVTKLIKQKAMKIQMNKLKKKTSDNLKSVRAPFWLLLMSYDHILPFLA
jgi:hypothetical protein